MKAKQGISLLAVLLLLVSLAACASGQPASETEDGQNPVMNFVGVYVCGRGSMLVEPDGMDGAKITVTWGSSASENSVWVMTGKLDAETNTVTYSDCVRTDYVFSETGDIDSETVAYENGTGSVTFLADGDLTLTWTDDQDQIADGSVFEYASMGD